MRIFVFLAFSATLSLGYNPCWPNDPDMSTVADMQYCCSLSTIHANCATQPDPNTIDIDAVVSVSLPERLDVTSLRRLGAVGLRVTVSDPRAAFNDFSGNGVLTNGNYNGFFYYQGRAILNVDFTRMGPRLSMIELGMSEEAAAHPSARPEPAMVKEWWNAVNATRAAREATATAAKLRGSGQGADLDLARGVDLHKDPQLVTCHTAQIVAIVGTFIMYDNCMKIGPTKWFELCSYREPAAPDAVWVGVKNGDRIFFSAVLTRTKPSQRILVSLYDNSCERDIPRDYSVLGLATLQVDPQSGGYVVIIQKGMIINDEHKNTILPEFPLSVE